MTSASSTKPIIYDEIFDDNSLPSEQGKVLALVKGLG